MCLDYQTQLKEQVLNKTARNNVPEAWCTQCIFDWSSFWYMFVQYV